MAYQAVVNDVGVIETQSLNAYSASHPWLLTVQTGTVLPRSQHSLIF